MGKTSHRLLVSELEAAQMLGVCKRTLHNLRQEGAIPHVRIKTRVLYSVPALESWLASREQAASV